MCIDYCSFGVCGQIAANSIMKCKKVEYFMLFSAENHIFCAKTDYCVNGKEDIKNIISKLNSSKAHGDDMISIGMLKLCDKSILKPLSIIFKSCLTQGIFQSDWKKANVPIHKKAASSVLQTTDLSPFSQSVAKF